MDGTWTMDGSKHAHSAYRRLSHHGDDGMRVRKASCTAQSQPQQTQSIASAGACARLVAGWYPGHALHAEHCPRATPA
eukprot:scaffold3960_cov116-Isochrysis_galbana.AAC.13